MIGTFEKSPDDQAGGMHGALPASGSRAQREEENAREWRWTWIIVVLSGWVVKKKVAMSYLAAYSL